MNDEITVFLSFAFLSTSRAYTKGDIIAAVEKACEIATDSMQSLDYAVSIHCEFLLENYGVGLNQQVREKIERSDIAVVDVSDTNWNVGYEMGLAHGAHRQTILIRQKDSKSELSSDVQGLLAMQYTHISDIRGQLGKSIKDALMEILLKQDRFSPSMRRLWNLGEETPTAIYVVGPDTRRRENLPDTFFPNKLHPDYSRMEFIGDKDAVVEAMQQLARLYSSALTDVYPSSWLSSERYRDPLVVIGGPLGDEGGGNSLTKDISTHWHLPISYTNDCEALLVNGQEYRTQYSTEGAENLLIDYGVIARLPNPWYQKRRVLLLHGIHTYGVFGAVQAISNSVEGKANTDTISQVCGPDPLFYAWCEVSVVGGTLTIPKVELTHIIPFSSEKFLQA